MAVIINLAPAGAREIAWASIPDAEPRRSADTAYLHAARSGRFVQQESLAFRLLPPPVLLAGIVRLIIRNAERSVEGQQQRGLMRLKVFGFPVRLLELVIAA